MKQLHNMITDFIICSEFNLAKFKPNLQGRNLDTITLQIVVKLIDIFLQIHGEFLTLSIRQLRFNHALHLH